jgi:hypothetical protein
MDVPDPDVRMNGKGVLHCGQDKWESGETRHPRVNFFVEKRTGRELL